MIMNISKKELTELYDEIRVELGYPVRNIVELEEENFKTFFNITAKEYNAKIQTWLINQQWGSLEGLSLDTSNFTLGFTQKTIDFEKRWMAAFAKQTGRGIIGDYELKKDFVTISGDTQVYTIPKNREINEVLWYTPPQVGINGSFYYGGDFSSSLYGWSYGGIPAQTVLPTFGLVLSAQDRLAKKKVLQSELTYRIVGGPNGTKQLFLYPVPGSRLEIRGRFPRTIEGQRVYYFYYDTNNTGRDKCLEDNNDIVKLPDDIPLESQRWGDSNEITKSRIRKLLKAKIMRMIGLARGMHEGNILQPVEGQNLKLDYRMYLEEGEKLETKTLEEIKEDLEKITWKQVTEDKAAIAENLKRIHNLTPPREQIFRF